MHGLQARHASLNKFSELHLLVISPAKQFLIDLLSILTGSEAQRIPTEDYIKLPGIFCGYFPFSCSFYLNYYDDFVGYLSKYFSCSWDKI